MARFENGDWSPIDTGLRLAPEALLPADSGTGLKVHVAHASGVLRHEGERWERVGAATPEIHPRALIVHDDGSGAALYAAGFGATPVVRLEGTRWTPLESQPGGSVFVLAEFDEGAGKRLFAGGILTHPGGRRDPLLRWDGHHWSCLEQGLSTTPPYGGEPAVHALAVYDDGSGPALFVGGQFSSAGGEFAPYVAKWDGRQWIHMGNPLTSAQGFNAPVRALLSFDDGNGPALFAGGSFTSSGTRPMDYIARWNGLRWNAVGSGMDAEVSSLAAHDDGRGPALFAGGRFRVAGDLAARGIARWDGTSWSALGSGLEAVGRLLSANLGTGPLLVAAGDFFVAESGDSRLAAWGCPDSEPPALDCAPVHVIDRPADGPGEFVELTVGVRDLDPRPTLHFSPPSGSFFARGTTLVTCTATDASGNSTTCTFDVRVEARFRRR